MVRFYVSKEVQTRLDKAEKALGALDDGQSIMVEQSLEDADGIAVTVDFRSARFHKAVDDRMIRAGFKKVEEEVLLVDGRNYYSVHAYV